MTLRLIVSTTEYPSYHTILDITITYFSFIVCTTQGSELYDSQKLPYIEYYMHCGPTKEHTKLP